MLTTDPHLSQMSGPGEAAPYEDLEAAIAIPADRAPVRFVTQSLQVVDAGFEPLPSVADSGDAESAWRVAYGALDLARLVSGAPGGALLACVGAGLRLLASRGVEQSHLEALRGAWTDPGSGLSRGQPYAHRWPPCVALPCIDGATIVGVMLLTWSSEKVQAASALAPLARVLGALLRRLGVTGGVALGGSLPVPPAATAVVDTRAFALYVLLEEHEWNVARVARLLGVTRMTVYNRMRAAGIPRQRVSKSQRRRPGQLPAFDVSALPLPPDARAAVAAASTSNGNAETAQPEGRDT